MIARIAAWWESLLVCRGECHWPMHPLKPQPVRAPARRKVNA